VNFEDAAGREAAKQRAAHLGGINAGLSGKCKRFTHGHECPANHELVARLADLPSTGCANMNDALGIAHGFEHRANTVERGSITAHHDRESAVDGTDLSAADRRIEQRSTRLAGRRRQSHRYGRRNRAHVYYHGAWLHGAEHTISTSQHALDIGSIRQHGDYTACVSSDFCRRRGSLGTCSNEFVDRAAAAVVHDDRRTAFEQIARHGPAHDAEADEAYGIGHGPER
jgi:hypothetical protein